MAILEQEKAKPKPFTQEVLDQADLPLQRLYACELANANDLLFTQPVDGVTTEWTWKSALQEVRRIVSWIKEQDWPPGSRIVIFSRNSAWWIMADFAIWMSGHISVPLFPATHASLLTMLFRHSAPVACFLGQIDHPLPLSEDAFSHLSYVTFPNIAAPHIPPGSTSWSDIVHRHTPLDGNPLRPGGDVATIIYTSGTTGEPKGAMQSFQSLSLMAKSMEPAFQNMRGGDRTISYLPLAHIAERAIIEMNALFMPIHIYFSEGLEKFLVDLKRSRSTLFFSVPRLYIRFQQKVFEKIPEKRLNLLLAIPVLNWFVRKNIRRQLGLDHARIVAVGGASTPVEIIKWYLKLGINFIEGYGMTETGITHVVLPGETRVGFVGSSSQYAKTRISADGEVQIKGPMNMLGYYSNPGLTRLAFTDDEYFRTGDRGEIDVAGRLRLYGRLKEEFKTAKGKFIVPSRIEKFLSVSLLFESTAIFGAGMTAPFAMVVLVPEMRQACQTQRVRTAMEIELCVVLDQLNNQLEHHEQLSRIVICNQPWTTANGFITPTLKVRRTAIENHFASRFAEWERLEQKVIWLEDQ
jgi:long-chain acyl-CoA synthetase